MKHSRCFNPRKLRLVIPLIALALLASRNAEAGRFFLTAEMSIRRENFTATTLLDGRVLVAGGRGTVDNQATFFQTDRLASAEIYDPAAGRWTATGDMIKPRYGHRAILLPNGTVLAVGGLESDASTEIYDPVTGSWNETGTLSIAHPGGTATLLPDGKILVTGGSKLNGETTEALRTAELYDPGAGKWAETGSMQFARSQHSAVLLADGKVLVSGGQDFKPEGSFTISNAELYDPATGTWTRTTDMMGRRSGHTSTLLSNHKVLVAGDDSAELYDPATRNWTRTGPMSIDGISGTGAPFRGGLWNHTATALPDGKVLVASVFGLEAYDPMSGKWSSDEFKGIRTYHVAALLANGNLLIAGGNESRCWGCPIGSTSAVIYDPILRRSWTKTSSLMAERYTHTTTLLLNGTVLITGEHRSSETFDENTGAWTPSGNLLIGRLAHTASLLQNGRVLVAGGYAPADFSFPANAELYDPATRQWGETGALNKTRYNHTATLLGNGKVLVAGGHNGTERMLSSTELYDPASGRWSVSSEMKSARAYGHTATLFSDGRLLVAGGRSFQDHQDHSIRSAEIYDPVTESWSETAPMERARSGHTATLLHNGNVLVTGGYSALAEGGSSAVKASELYNPSTASWTATGSMSKARGGHSAILLPDGNVLVTGGGDYSAEFYDPDQQKWTRLGPIAPAGAATLLTSGKVLLVQGRTSFVLDAAKLFLPVLGLQFVAGKPIIHLSGLPGAKYQIESSERIAGDWAQLADIDLLSNPFTLLDNSALSSPTRFYRVIAK